MASFFSSLLFSLALLSPVFADATGKVGVNYGRIANNLPTPSQVVQLLKTQGLTRAKIFDTDPNVLKSFSNSGIDLTVAMTNQDLESAAGSQSYTDTWIKTNILPYHPATNISAIAVGNEVNVDSSIVPYLVPAMTNLYASLKKNSLDGSIKVSSPIALSALGNSYPASAGSFKKELVSTMIQPMLQFLRKTNSFLMVNVYPFFAYAANTDEISLDYALFKPNAGVADSGSGLKYYSLFEAQLDAVFAAMKALKFDDLKVKVTETGWPSQGDKDEVGAGSANAAAYNGNLVKRVLTGKGTPLRPNDPLDVYLFALFNENQKSGPTSERNYGLFYPNEQKVYDIALTLKGVAAGAVAPTIIGGDKGDVGAPVAIAPAVIGGNKGDVVTSPAPAPVVNVGAPTPAPVVNGGSKANVGQTWCVANEKVSNTQLQVALDWACGQGQADCTPIQPGATCYDPNSLTAHASYAFNSYYQLKSRAAGTCDFGGAAYVVTQSPKFGSCIFPTGY